MTKATYTQRERKRHLFYFIKQPSTLDSMPLIMRFNIGIEPLELFQYLSLVGTDKAGGLLVY